MTIISGHQRFKAARDLEIKMVPIRIREDLIDEDKKLKVLLAANFGRNKNDEAKQRKVAVEYVRLCGYKNGDNQWGCQNGTPSEKLTLDEIAAQLGTSKRDLQRALSIERNLTESVKELLDTGVISKTLAADTISTLSESEQEELISKLDVTKKYTQKQVQKYIDEIKQLKSKPEKIVEKIVDNTDYREIENLKRGLISKDETISQLKSYKADYHTMQKEFQDKVSELQTLRKQIETMNDNSPRTQYEKKLQDSTLLFCAKVANFIEQVGGYIWLTDKINEIPELEREGYVRAVHMIKEWADTMVYNMNNKLKELN